MGHVVHSRRAKTPLWVEGDSTNIVAYGCNLSPPESEKRGMTSLGQLP